MKIGIIYSTVDGQTKKICEKLVKVINQHQIKAELFSINTFQKNVTDYDTLIIGASIRYGIHSSRIKRFIKDYKSALMKIHTAFFSVNLVARKANKNSPATNPYLKKFLHSIDWKPDIVEVFAGRLDYQKYSWIDKLMIKLIMKLTDGPTKSDTEIEYTDWDRVQLFAEKICELKNS